MALDSLIAALGFDTVTIGTLGIGPLGVGELVIG